MTLILVSDMHKVQVLQKICQNAVKLKPEWKFLQTNGLALTSTPTLRNHWANGGRSVEKAVSGDH
jgi:hypothetical protein